MARRRRKWLLFAIGAGSMLLWGYDRTMMMDWVGVTELEVEFAVSDVDSGNAVSGARIEVQSEGGFYEEDYKQEFMLSTDSRGAARKECRNSMCFGVWSGLGFTDTYHVHLPFWFFRVVAPGYEPGEWTALDVPEYRPRVKRFGPRRPKLVVPVSLHKGQV